jgi:hypothetical protein
MRDVGLTSVHASTPVIPESSLVAWTGPTPAKVLHARDEHDHRLLDDAAATAYEAAPGVGVQTTTNRCRARSGAA